MWWQASGVMVKAWSDPQFIVTLPGLIVPWAPWVTVIAWVSIAKLAAMVWFALTPVKV